MLLPVLFGEFRIPLVDFRSKFPPLIASSSRRDDVGLIAERLFTSRSAVGSIIPSVLTLRALTILQYHHGRGGAFGSPHEDQCNQEPTRILATTSKRCEHPTRLNRQCSPTPSSSMCKHGGVVEVAERFCVSGHFPAWRKHNTFASSRFQ